MIYADYNGTSPLLPSVREYLKKRMDGQVYANPNAIHSIGQKVFQGIEKCRIIISEIVGCYPDQLYFNSGSTEGISTIIHSVLEYCHKKTVITTRLEHAAVAKTLQFYEERRGVKLVFVDTIDGRIDLSHFEKLMESHKHDVALVAIMAANNETGVLQPFKEIAQITSKSKVDFFCDTTQLIGKEEFNFEESGIDFAICSGHKCGALTGVGFILAKEPTKLRPYIFGSLQEKGLRGGTQHYIGIETLAVALKDFDQNKHKIPQLKKARLSFEQEIKRSFPEVVIIGEKSDRLAGTTLIGYPGIHGQAVQIELESMDIFVTTSAACSDNQPETSQVLKAMGIDDQLGRGVVRISLSYSQGEKEYSALVQALKQAYTKLAKIKSY